MEIIDDDGPGAKRRQRLGNGAPNPLPGTGNHRHAAPEIEHLVIFAHHPVPLPNLIGSLIPRRQDANEIHALKMFKRHTGLTKEKR